MLGYFYTLVDDRAECKPTGGGGREADLPPAARTRQI